MLLICHLPGNEAFLGEIDATSFRPSCCGSDLLPNLAKQSVASRRALMNLPNIVYRISCSKLDQAQHHLVDHLVRWA